MFVAKLLFVLGHCGIDSPFAAEAKAEVDRANNDGKTPLILAVSYGHTDCVRRLLHRRSTKFGHKGYLITHLR